MLSGMEEFLVRLQAEIRAPQFAGLFLLVAGVLSYESYEVRELLICWLLFALLFASIALAILGSMLACRAGKYLIYWAGMPLRAARAHVHLNVAKAYALLVRSGRRVFSS